VVLDLKRELRDSIKKMAGPDVPEDYEKQFRQRLLGYQLNTERPDHENKAKSKNET
jgi:hypothetical protein